VLDHAQGGFVLNARRGERGFSLLELMVILALVAIMLVIAVRAFAGWSADGKVRATAESLLNALRVAQSNAVAHNRITVFSLTAATPSTTADPSNSGSNWFLNQVKLSGSDEASATLIQSATIARQYGVTLAGSPTITGASTDGTSAPLCFNPLGQLTTQTAAAVYLSAGCTAPTDNLPVIYNVSSANATRQFQVRVYPGGQMRMCDAAKTLSNTNPDGC
jgi:type IV fimbrial biogenesis protein FimT